MDTRRMSAASPTSAAGGLAVMPPVSHWSVGPGPRSGSRPHSARQACASADRSVAPGYDNRPQLSVRTPTVAAMSTYQGPAVVAINGKDIPVTVNLRSNETNGRETWGGAIRAVGDNGLTDLLNAGQAPLRMPDGREGSIILRSSGVGAADGSATLAIIFVGSGDAPF